MTAATAWWIAGDESGSIAVFLAVGSLSAILFSMAKAGFGAGIAILSVPLMVYACGGARLALGIMLPILIAADYVAVAHWWRKWNWPAVLRMLPGATTGVVLAWTALKLVAHFGEAGGEETVEAALKLGIGVIAVAFVLLQIARKLRRRPLTFRPVFWQAAGAGGVAGLTSTLGHAAGPVTAMYLLSQNMPKGRYVATTALFFWLLNQIKLPFYLELGLIHPASLTAGAALLPAIAVGAFLGVFLHRRIGQRQFDGVVYTLLAIAGGHLIYKGIASLPA
jgi:hypothetical protein